MLEYFSFKKGKKALADKKEKGKEKENAQVTTQEPLLSPEDENFLRKIISREGTPPPLPQRPVAVMNVMAGDAHGEWTDVPEAGDTVGNVSQMVLHENPTEEDSGRRRHEHPTEADTGRRRRSGGSERKKSSGSESKRSAKKAKAKDNKRSSTFAFFQKKNKDGLEPKKNVSKEEADEEMDDISRVLDNLNLSASNNRAFSLSAESQNLVKQFTVILKDLVNGVPTAYDDLVKFLNDSQGTLARSYDHMPPFMKRLVTSLPNKLTSTLAPELLAVATEAEASIRGVDPEKVESAGGFKGAAQGLIGSIGLRELVTKPGAVAKLLKTIMNALKVRFPAFLGANVLLSLALFVLLFVFWYCHKRGRETRLEREGQSVPLDSEGRPIIPEDDPLLQAPTESSRAADSDLEGGVSGSSRRRKEESSSGESRRRRSGDESRRRSGEGSRRSRAEESTRRSGEGSRRSRGDEESTRRSGEGSRRSRGDENRRPSGEGSRRHRGDEKRSR